MPADRVFAYLQRFAGLKPDQKLSVRLSSAQKASLAAWMRQNGIPFSSATLQQPCFSIAALLKNDETVAPTSLSVHGNAAQRGHTRLSPMRVGIDIEQVTFLPDAVDYREHEFYRDNFTPNEISYCLQRNDPKRSLCGLWAAKEAAVKALGGSSANSMRAIEIDHDQDGRPVCSLGEVSISHSGDFSVALFVALPRKAP